MGVLRLGWVTGLTAEARLLKGVGPVEVGGGTPAGAEAAAGRLRDVDAIVSFGLAGGLDPALAAGTVVIPEAVIVAGQVVAADPQVNARLGGATHRLLAMGTGIVATRAGKAAAFAATGAVAVDLESGAVARVAAARGMGFAVLRAICDPATADLPPAALAALDAGGAIGLWRVLRSVLAEPGQVPALLGLARDAGRARGALTRALAGI